MITATRTLLTAAAALAIPVATHGAVTLPYSNDFSSSVSDFTITTADGVDTDSDGIAVQADFALNTADGVLAINLVSDTSDLDGGGSLDKKEFAYGTALLEATDPALRTDGFIQSMTFKLTSPTGGVNSLFLHAFSDSFASNPTQVDDVLMKVEINQNRIKLGSATIDLPETPVEEEFVENESYQFVVEGTPNGSNIDLHATLTRLSDGAVLISASNSDEDLPSNGDYFGFGATSNEEHSYEITDYSLQVVPEPASLGLAGLGMAGLLLRRRR